MCDGWGLVNGQAAIDYAKRNYPTRTWIPNWVANCDFYSGGGCPSYYFDYQLTLGGTANYAKAMNEACNIAGGHEVKYPTYTGSTTQFTYVCEDSLSHNIALKTYRDTNTPMGTNGGSPSDLFQFYSAWPDGIPH